MAKVKTDLKIKKLKAIKKDKIIHFRIPAFIYQTVKDIARENNCTNSEVVRALVMEKFLAVNRINYERTE